MIAAHEKTIEELYDILDTDKKGLTNAEAEQRLEKYGRNELAEGEKINPLRIFLSQFKDLLVIILIVAGIITAFLGFVENDENVIIEISAIIIVILLNAGLGFYQEYSAEKAIEALRSLSKSEVIVLRDDEKVKLKAELLVPGDIVLLEAGNVIPADIRLIKGYEVNVNEAILTGESMSVQKETETFPTETPLADRKNMLYKGTTIASGSGKGVVAFTGYDTELGKIAASLTKIESEETPIQKKLKLLAKQLTIFIVIIAATIFFIQIVFIGIEEFTELLIFAIGLAVAAVPEGLPAVMTLSLAIGVTRMARQKALIRKLPAVEVLGSSTVICTDKTGTLTKNEMTVTLVWTTRRQYNVTGTGYTNIGQIMKVSTAKQVEPDYNPELEHLIEIGTLSNEASIEFQGEGKPYKTFGDPTEIALLILAEKGQTVESINNNWEIEYMFPFDSNRKRMSVIAKNKKTGEYEVMVKGALDIMLERCEKYLEEGNDLPLDNDLKQKIVKVSERFSTNFAYRVLGLASRKLSPQEAQELLEQKKSDLVEQKLTFVGFVGIIDPPRETSRPAVIKAEEAGIRVMMITGDHKATAQAIGREVGLCKNVPPITGKVLENMSDEELDVAVKETEIFARVDPSHKLRIVNALKKQDEIVIMTGDGVNDAPALKRADIGVAMGITGTDVAKEASEMILVDDNFANIIDAVSEGRRIYDNIKKFITYLLSANAGEVLTVLAIVLLGIFFFNHIIIPILAIQLLYINLVTDTFPALALGVSPPEEDLMKRKPRDPKEPLLNRNLILFIISFGILNAIGCLFLFMWSINYNFALNLNTADLTMQRTMIFAALVVYQIIQCLSVGSNETIFSKSTFKNKTLLGAVGLSILLLLFAIYFPFLQPFIGTAPLEPIHWFMILLTAIPILFFEELYERFILKAENEVVLFEIDTEC
ncbi:MAG: HAD-IC family P-type ATPase [Candidatus Lokiarchaeota archaeon]|nr:HAD-IC family P-type ATPase [Candidatus Lokiarchaeota archaeon]MBD3341269.1 HAD-IC family P-type ATPase [Candidatus Lokiarchaeota archaeon]